MANPGPVFPPLTSGINIKLPQQEVAPALILHPRNLMQHIVSQEWRLPLTVATSIRYVAGRLYSTISFQGVSW